MSVVKYQTGAEDNLRLNYHLLLLSRRNIVRIPYFSAITQHNYGVLAKTELRKAFLLQQIDHIHTRITQDKDTACPPIYVRYNYEMTISKCPIDNRSQWSLVIGHFRNHRCEMRDASERGTLNIEKSQEQTSEVAK
jgi:regulation of enolase protein 1 (concanavalin A-like superfamily)